MLKDVRVLEIGHFIAGPFAARALADLGADVIKVEPPGLGDPIRSWGERIDGQSLWWSVHGRNKRCVTLNLRHPGARQTSCSVSSLNVIASSKTRKSASSTNGASPLRP